MDLSGLLSMVGFAGLILTGGFAWLARDPLGYTPPVFDWLIAGFVVLLLISLGALRIREAGAHEAPAGWAYPLSCCSNFDCRELEEVEVRETAQGYLIVATGEVVPYGDKRIRNSPDGRFHWCAHQPGVHAGRTICLFVPPRSF